MEPQNKTRPLNCFYANLTPGPVPLPGSWQTSYHFQETKSSINYYYSKLSYQGRCSFTSLVTSPTASFAHVVRTQGRSDYGSIIIEGRGVRRASLFAEQRKMDCSELSGPFITDSIEYCKYIIYTVRCVRAVDD